MQTASLYAMAIFYILAGANHFRDPRFYLKMIPSYLPYHRPINTASGAIEILLGVLLLIPKTREFALIGIMILLILVLPANIEMAKKNSKFNQVPRWMRLLRIPIQVLPLAWAYWHFNNLS